MASPPQPPPEADQHDMALDAAGKLGEAYQRRARRVLQHGLPAAHRAVRNCETDGQKRAYLSALRREDEAAYAAFAYEAPGEVVGEEGEEDPEAEARRREEHAYAGPYVKGWDQATESRVLERDASGKPVVVRQRQRELFGTAWTRTWQEGGSRARGDVMEEEVGPSGETAGVEVAPPAGVTWEGLAEMQRRERKGYERAKTRGLRGEREILAAVREFFRGVRRKLRESRGWGRKVEVPRGEGGGKVAEMRSSEGLDSGYASMVKG